MRTLFWITLAVVAVIVLVSLQHKARAGNCFTSCQNGPGYSHCQTHCD